MLVNVCHDSPIHLAFTSSLSTGSHGRRAEVEVRSVASMSEPIDREIRLALWKIHILYHAAKRPVYGLWMLDELAEHGHRLSPGTLYPILHELEASGYLKATEEVVGGKRRKNLRTTIRGRKLLAEAREKVVELASEIVDDDDAMARRRKEENGNS